MTPLQHTPLFPRHQALNARIVPFGGYAMPVMYSKGIIEEHLATRKQAGLFDVSHMGRFVIRGSDRTAFLQHVLTSNVLALDGSERGAQYTFIPREDGGALDDAYLYRFTDQEFMLVVNASNRNRDWEHLQEQSRPFSGVELLDLSEHMAMLAIQGPLSREIMADIITEGRLPEPARNALSTVSIQGRQVQVARTGYTGEPLGFEIFVKSEAAPRIWDSLLERGAEPVGLGARDTLRLEAGLPLYGHELGQDPEGGEIPIFAVPMATVGVSFHAGKGDFIGRQALRRQHEARKRFLFNDFSRIKDLPRRIVPLALLDRGIAREGSRVFSGQTHVGWVTSGTMVPYWIFEGQGLFARPTDQSAKRSICLAYLDSDIQDGSRLSVEVRSRMVEGVVVPYHLRSESPPYARPILADETGTESESAPGDRRARAAELLKRAAANTAWRQSECINLIPSEMTASPAVRLLQTADPSFRYAEHRKVKAFHEQDVFYYQGTDFIHEVEKQLVEEIREFLGCAEVETRLISGQMANTAVFSALLDHLNQGDRKSEPRRMDKVMNNHIGKGGHLSAQPMGALKDFVARDPITERPAVVHFPVLEDNPYKIDVPATLELIERHRPELIIFGKSMVLTREPVREVRDFVDEQGIDTVILYDMAHVLGLAGPHFQEPFKDGADLVTASTHKTFFGPQRGLAASRFQPHEQGYGLWEALERRTFPGSVSNHHLGTMLACLMAAYEMNHFRDAYQQAVISNAKSFARALADLGLSVAGDPAAGFTETHQVVLEIGHGEGPGLARKLEANNIICNYQAGPWDESFSAAGALRMGVAEMTRFGMNPEGFAELAGLIRDVVINDKEVKDEVVRLRRCHLDLQYCFPDLDARDLLPAALQGGCSTP
jgi:aminomethyltransferase